MHLEKVNNMMALMVFLLVLLLAQFIVIIAYLDKSSRPYKRPDYLSHAAQDMVWNRDKTYRD